jgi:hypothetical protein
MLLSWNPFSPRNGKVTVKINRHTRLTNIGHTKSHRATWNRRPGSYSSDRVAVFASTVARESTRDVKLGDTLHYRTSAKESESSWKTIHNSQAEDKKNAVPRLGGDSPRYPLTGWNRLADALEDAGGSDKLVIADGRDPARSPGNDGSPSVDAIDEQPRGRANCSSDSADAAAGRSARSLSKDRSDAPDATRRLAQIAFLGNAEMGPRELITP